jgi:uncharacterized protein YjiS (DUF1127 family)
MSTTFGTINPAQPVWTQRAFALFKRYRDAFLGWRRRTQLQARLSDLNDRELRDIGLARGEIDFAAASAAAGLDPRFPAAGQDLTPHRPC